MCKVPKNIRDWYGVDTWFTGLSSRSPIVRLTKRVVVSTDISQVDGHCGPLMFPRYQSIRRQENKNCCGHSWSTKPHLGISTDMCEPLSPLGYQDTLSKSSLLPYKWEECGVGTQRCPRSQQKFNKVRWKEPYFQLLSFPSFSGTCGLNCFFASTSLFLNASERSLKETVRHHRADNIYWSSQWEQWTKTVTELMFCSGNY